MAIIDILNSLQNEINQCETLIAHAHASDHLSRPILPALDQKQITVAAFLNMFISWESFLEKAFGNYMTGGATINGNYPVKYVAPPSMEAAFAMIIGTHRYFDYGNHENVKKLATMYFENGYPFEPNVSSIISELADLRTMRNASAHITSTTQSALEALALRIFGQPRPGIDLYQLLVSRYPRAPLGNTVFTYYRDKLLIAASLIAKG